MITPATFQFIETDQLILSAFDSSTQEVKSTSLETSV